MFKVSKSSRKVGRIFSVLTGFILIILLLKGRYIDSTGMVPHDRIVTASDNPLEFYFFVGYIFVGFLISTVFGFVAKLKNTND